MDILFWTIAGFLAGSIPFSLILGKLLVRKDIRAYGDGNPGGTNALKAGGAKIGIPAILLDIFKGFLPVYLAKEYGVTGLYLIPVCLAPILGHAFSPFLNFKGGKALGTTGGVWVGLIGLWAFLIYAILAVPATLVQSEDAWSANIGMFALLGYSIIVGELWMVAFAALNTALIAWTHRKALVRPPQLRGWVTNILQGRHA